MGFMDKIKGIFNKMKEENRNFGTTMKRINNGSTFYGNINRGIKDGDFTMVSYVSIENGQGVIYGSNQDDYTFTANDVASFEISSDSFKSTLKVGDAEFPTLRYIITFKDGKKASADLIVAKVDAFKSAFGL